MSLLQVRRESLLILGNEEICIHSRKGISTQKKLSVKASIIIYLTNPKVFSSKVINHENDHDHLYDMGAKLTLLCIYGFLNCLIRI